MGSRTPAFWGAQDCYQILRSLDSFNAQGAFFPTILRSSDCDHSLVCALKQTVANVNQADMIETGCKQVPDDSGIVSLKDCFRNEHCKSGRSLR